MYSRKALVNYIVENLDSPSIGKQVGAYLMESGKVSDLESVLRDAQEQRAQQKGYVEVTVRSAHALDATQSESIKAIAATQYKNVKTVTTHEIIDPSVIGGANLSFPQTNLDVTIQDKLNQLRKAVK